MALGDEGLSFINTARDRDLGGALVAINTTGLGEVQVQWLAGTILENTRKPYGLVLQYRIGTEGSFTDIPTTEYISAGDGDVSIQEPVVLSEHLMEKEYIQLLWRYHFLSGTSGPRAQLRLDDIVIAAKPEVPVITQPTSASGINEDFTIQWTPAGRAQKYELQLAGNENFINPLTSEENITETSFMQTALDEASYYYIRVRAINEMTTGEWSEVVTLYSPATSVQINGMQKDKLSLYPNPFVQSAQLQLTLARPGNVEISLYDLSGRKATSIYQGYLPAGENIHTVEGENLPPGTYLLICRTESGTSRQKLVKK
jgi:hypothetical protein